MTGFPASACVTVTVGLMILGWHVLTRLWSSCELCRRTALMLGYSFTITPMSLKHKISFKPMIKSVETAPAVRGCGTTWSLWWWPCKRIQTPAAAPAIDTDTRPTSASHTTHTREKSQTDGSCARTSSLQMSRMNSWASFMALGVGANTENVSSSTWLIVTPDGRKSRASSAGVG